LALFSFLVFFFLLFSFFFSFFMDYGLNLFPFLILNWIC
jgi:hypothetical protein